MATVEEHLREMIGGTAFQVCVLTARCDQLVAEVERLKAELEKAAAK